jgi:hypothetical protein
MGQYGPTDYNLVKHKVGTLFIIKDMTLFICPLLCILKHMTDNNCCGGGDHDHGEEVEFSLEVQEAIAKYVVFMQEYNIPVELSAEELIQARMQTIYEDNGGCDDEGCVEEHDSPITTFMQNLLTEAEKKKTLEESDIKYIAEVASALDEAVYKDFIRITESLKLGVENDKSCEDDCCGNADDDDICNGACEDCTGVCRVGQPKYSHLHSADGIIKDESDDDLDEDEEHPHDKAIPSPFQ